jgi:hypothetical protein
VPSGTSCGNPSALKRPLHRGLATIPLVGSLTVGLARLILHLLKCPASDFIQADRIFSSARGLGRLASPGSMFRLLGHSIALPLCDSQPLPPARGSRPNREVIYEAFSNAGTQWHFAWRSDCPAVISSVLRSAGDRPDLVRPVGQSRTGRRSAFANDRHPSGESSDEQVSCLIATQEASSQPGPACGCVVSKTSHEIDWIVDPRGNEKFRSP